VVAGSGLIESKGPYTLQGRLVKVVGQLVPLGKHKENWTDGVGSDVTVGEGVGVGFGVMFLG
jgi:hypothetical protein